MRTILVIGAASFTGANYISYFLNENLDCQVVN